MATKPTPTTSHPTRTELKRLSASPDPRHRLDLALHLADVDRTTRYRRWGFPSFTAYCTQDLAIHIETARTLRLLTHELLEHARFTPTALRQMGWTKAKILIPLARAGRVHPRNRAAILTRARTLSSEALRAWVHRTLKHTTSPNTRQLVQFELTPSELKQLRRTQRHLIQTTTAVTPSQQLVRLCTEYLRTHRAP